jgi:protein-S-isoprenylcysteine O-methyltransferase Ste14
MVDEDTWYIRNRCVKLTAIVGDYFTRQLTTQTGQKAISNGPYAYVRHPGYLANALAFWPYFILMPPHFPPWNLAYAALAIAGWCYVWHVRISAEEAMMITDTPDYTDYKNRVQFRLLPGAY